MQLVPLNSVAAVGGPKEPTEVKLKYFVAPAGPKTSSSLVALEAFETAQGNNPARIIGSNFVGGSSSGPIAYLVRRIPVSSARDHYCPLSTSHEVPRGKCSSPFKCRLNGNLPCPAPELPTTRSCKGENDQAGLRKV